MRTRSVMRGNVGVRALFAKLRLGLAFLSLTKPRRREECPARSQRPVRRNSNLSILFWNVPDYRSGRALWLPGFVRDIAAPASVRKDQWRAHARENNPVLFHQIHPQRCRPVREQRRVDHAWQGASARVQLRLTNRLTVEPHAKRRQRNRRPVPVCKDDDRAGDSGSVNVCVRTSI